MPVYQYTCTQCGHDLEARQSFSDGPLTDCPTCGEDGALRKQFGSVGVVFKGSGFYRNDSRSSDSRQLAKNDSTAKSDNAESKSQTKSESSSGEKKSSGEAAKPSAPKKKEAASSKA
ncbi:MAG: FmdB family zinc ribbon protein [Stackebrandtia sp.]